MWKILWIVEYFHNKIMDWNFNERELEEESIVNMIRKI